MNNFPLQLNVPMVHRNYRLESDDHMFVVTQSEKRNPQSFHFNTHIDNEGCITLNIITSDLRTLTRREYFIEYDANGVFVRICDATYAISCMSSDREMLNYSFHENTHVLPGNKECQIRMATLEEYKKLAPHWRLPVKNPNVITILDTSF